MHVVDSPDSPANDAGPSEQWQNEPVMCDLSAIPSHERAAHATAARRLFADHEVRHIDGGVEVVLASDHLADAATFIGYERMCCRHLAFSIDVPARSASIIFRVRGPGAWDQLRALLA